MTLTPMLCAAIVAATLLVLWIIHRVNRMFEDRCPIYGKLRQSVKYFMEESRSASSGTFRGVPYDTYKMLVCSRSSCGNVRVYFRQKYMAHTSLWLKHTFKPWQLRRTVEVDTIIEGAFRTPAISSRRRLVIPPVHLPEQAGTPSRAHRRDGGMGVLLHSNTGM